MKYIIRYGTREREFQGTPSEIMELKSRLESKKNLEESVATYTDKKLERMIDSLSEKVTETLAGGEKIEREI